MPTLKQAVGGAFGSAMVTWATLVAVGVIPVPSERRFHDDNERWGMTVLRVLHRSELNREATEEQIEGYYEGLLNEGARVSVMNRVVTGAGENEPGELRDTHRHRGDFLYYDTAPNVDLPELHVRLKTNSHGMPDREYAVAKPANVHRIAVVGDSITRGQGATFGANFETLLETAIASRPSGDGREVEILNFSVGGYHLTQLVDVALDKVPPFSPDVYVLSLTDHSVFRRWSRHLTTLVQEGIDLKYDVLRDIAVKAQAKRTDSAQVLEAKFARFRGDVLRWALGSIAEQARQQRAEFVVLLLPTVSKGQDFDEKFITTRKILGELGIRYVDLLGAFEALDDLEPYRVSETNWHPNDRGHQHLFEHLTARLEADAQLADLFRWRAPDRAALGTGAAGPSSR